MYSIEYKKIFGYQIATNDISFVDLGKKIKRGYMEPIICDGFGNHFLGKDLKGQVSLIYLINSSPDFPLPTLWIHPLKYINKGKSDELIFEFGLKVTD